MKSLNLATVNDVFVRASSRGDKTAMLWQDPGGVWKPITSDELYGRVRALAEVLSSWGVQRGDRVALISENRWEWPVTDFAAMALGAVDVPLFPTLTPEQVGYMLRDSGSKVVVVSSAKQYKKVVEAGDLPALEHIVVMDEGEFEGADSFSALMAKAGEYQARDAAFDAQVASVRPEELSTIIYTSGTTGDPKGVMLTQGNFAANLSISTSPFDFTEQDSCISFLPLSHVTARHVDYVLLARAVTLAYCPRLEGLAPAMQTVKPTIFVGVPRVYEKLRQTVESRSRRSPVKKRIFQWALSVGKAHRKAILKGKTPWAPGWKLANKLVFSKIQEAFGGRVQVYVAGGAPLGMDTGGWFADVGIRILEGYGLTETSPVIGLNYPKAYKFGTIGQPLANVQCRFAEDGELEVKGPSIFRGYWNKPQETAEAFSEDGWFRTGDIGNLDADGFISITDRKKELLKTSNGKLVAPQPIENRLKANGLVAQAALVGDKRKYVSVLISPNLAELAEWAKDQGISSTDPKALVKDEKVVKLYKSIVDQVNGTLAPYEAMRRITIVPDEWSIEDGTLTPSMKLKRRIVEKRYATEIGEFYRDEVTVKA
ncbi:MAG TPA: long-chain fatty acid--CoA ligase [Granulicella sp.]